VDVQVQVAPGLAAFNIVGPPDKAVSEARERVRAALVVSGLALPARRITINLAPADLPKEDSHYDLPIALGLMAAIGANTRGHGLICPAACGPEAAWASPEIDIVAAQSPIQLANHFKGTQVLTRPLPRIRASSTACRSTSPTSRARRAPSARFDWRTYAPMRRRTGRCWKRSRAPTAAGWRYCATPPTRCICRRAAITVCCASPRTLADLDGAEKVGRVHFAEALSYRVLADEVRRAA
jgi:magnesium chelatase family protein